ncbi:bifunctional nicotinamidase/pyrazinamidase [Inquilinus limosus]|uniref:Nicotinamidase n=1 Tax=Inquilinus limosus MP06 TaxID=1398085 RepID=A0A0A0D173_9PROT|nr:bifunctional nicotinamidase/pyrazinamidase [Inquilinus limosus]KGM32446.1 nicotinamidase [Inquilinus limosus MP06]
MSRIGRRTFLTAAGAVAASAWLRPGIAAAATITPGDADVLLVIDVQNCFLPGGSLAVADGDKVVPVINALATRFPNIVATQDWHTPGHVSFASAHPGAKPFDTVKLPYGDQVLWPDHCVQGTGGAELSAGLKLPTAELVIRKGYHPTVDSYSAFNEADGTPTGLAGYLKERGIRRVFAVGVATDFCVCYSAIDARKAGFEAFVIDDACRGIDTEGSLAKAWTAMTAAGVQKIVSADIG